MRRELVLGAAVLALGLALPAGPAGAQSRSVPTIRESLTPPPAAPAPGPPSFGSVPSARQRIRIEMRDATGATRETRITIQEAPSTGGVVLAPGSRTGFGSVPSFDRQIRITTEGAPVATPIEVPIIIVPRP